MLMKMVIGNIKMEKNAEIITMIHPQQPRPPLFSPATTENGVILKNSTTKLVKLLSCVKELCAHYMFYPTHTACDLMIHMEVILLKAIVLWKI